MTIDTVLALFSNPGFLWFMGGLGAFVSSMLGFIWYNYKQTSNNRHELRTHIAVWDVHANNTKELISLVRKDLVGLTDTTTALKIQVAEHMAVVDTHTKTNERRLSSLEDAVYEQIAPYSRKDTSKR